MTACIEGRATNGCRGYPQRRTRDGRNVRLHREAMERQLGRTLGSDEEVIHLCHNKRCVNVEHLKVGTHAENMRMMAEAGRSPRGERNGQAKLKAWEVRWARRVSSLYSLEAIADELGCTASNIKKIVRRQSWRHVA